MYSNDLNKVYILRSILFQTDDERTELKKEMKDWWISETVGFLQSCFT